MKWILWLALTLVLGYVTLRAVLAVYIGTKLAWLEGDNPWSAFIKYDVTTMVTAIKENSGAGQN